MNGFFNWGMYQKGDRFWKWIREFEKLGYEWKITCFNAQFSYPQPTPQSRDRLFITFWKKGVRPPNVDFTPPAQCSNCRCEVPAVQVWKRHKSVNGKPVNVGSYAPLKEKRNQYWYSCPGCGEEVFPYTIGASSAIDWSLPIIKIKDRASHGLPKLEQSTLDRVRKGLERYVMPFLIHMGHWQDVRLYDSSNPSPAITTKGELAVGIPPAFIDVLRSHNHATLISEPTATVTTSGAHHGLVMPPGVQVDEDGQLAFEIEPFITAYHGGRSPTRPVGEPSYTVATENQLSLAMPPKFITTYHKNGANTGIEEPVNTVWTTVGHALVEPDWSMLVEECGYRMLKPHEVLKLQGFRGDYILLGNQSDRYRMVGNAVPPPVARMFARAYAEVL